MEGNVKKSKFSFEGYIIKDAELHLTNNERSSTINFNFNPSGTIDKKNRIFTLELKTCVYDDTKSFEMNITTSATFKYVEDDNGNIEMNYLLLNAPAIVFPYIRAYIANLSALSGIRTILLPTINMAGLVETLRENINTIEQ